MHRLKRYTLPIILATLALLSLGAGILAVTVWKPSQEVSAEAQTSLPFTMTRPGVLRLYEPYQESAEVHVEAIAPGDEIVWMALGKGDDVSAWLTDESYDEIIGLSDLETLKAITHESTNVAQSDEVTAAEEIVEEPQSGADPLASNPIDSDMWTALKYGRHSVSMTLKGDELDQVLLAATNGSDPAPTIRLTWATPHSNTLALVAFSLAGVFAFLALGTYAALYRLRPTASKDLDDLDNQHQDREPLELAEAEDKSVAAEVDAVVGAEATSTAKKPRRRPAKAKTETAPVEEVAGDELGSEPVDSEAELADAASDFEAQIAAAKANAREEDRRGRKSAKKTSEDSQAAAEPEASEVTEVALTTEGTPDGVKVAAVEGTLEGVEVAEDVIEPEIEPAPAKASKRKSSAAPRKSTGAKKAQAEQTEAQQTPEPQVQQEPVAESADPVDQDAEAKTEIDATTGGVGVINLATARAGVPFPTRRALREAEKRGVDAVVVGERRFETRTGQIPKIAIEGTENIEDLSWSELMERLGRPANGDAAGKDQ